MKYTAKDIKLKNGQTAHLKAPTAEDAAEIISYMKTVFGETDFLMRYPEEYVMSVEDEAKILEGLETNETSLMICCEMDGKLVGNCQLSFNQRIKTAHRATVAISVLKDFWGLGIGTAIRTGVVLVMAWLIVFAKGKQKEIKYINKKELLFIVLSGIATGASWLCYYYAIQNGIVSVVVPIDKMSIVPTVLFSYIVFKEKLSKKSALGLCMMVVGTLVMTIWA